MIHRVRDNFSFRLLKILIIIINHFLFFSLEFEMHRSKIVKVKGNSGASVSFMVIPKEIGYITIAANATTNIAADGIETKLLVKVYIYYF